MKRAAMTGLAFDPDCSAHQVNEAPGDSQAQTGPAIFSSGGTIGLRECVENHTVLVAGNADAAILHAEMQLGGFVGKFTGLNADRNFSVLGELDGVSDQIY